jgi:DNA polymerase-3 subunit delta'
MQDHSVLFKMTESYRAGAEGQEKTTALLRALSSLLEDLLLLTAGVPDRIRNVDKRAELERMAAGFDYPWIEAAVRAMDQVQSGMRRNLLRSLSLDAMAVGLEAVR